MCLVRPTRSRRRGWSSCRAIRCWPPHHARPPREHRRWERIAIDDHAYLAPVVNKLPNMPGREGGSLDSVEACADDRWETAHARCAEASIRELTRACGVVPSVRALPFASDLDLFARPGTHSPTNLAYCQGGRPREQGLVPFPAEGQGERKANNPSSRFHKFNTAHRLLRRRQMPDFR